MPERNVFVDKTGQQWAQSSDGCWWILPGWKSRKEAQAAMAEMLMMPLDERNVVGLTVRATKRGNYTVHALRVRHKGLWYGRGANPGNPFVDEVVQALAPIAVEVKGGNQWN